MKLLNLNGKEYSVNVNKYIVHINDNKNKSFLHITARTIVSRLFNSEIILEEVPVKVFSKTLYLDFLIPTRKVAIEVNGQQHYEFNPMFHKSKQHFNNSRKNDVDKESWAEKNKIKLIILPFNKQEEWRDLIVADLCK